MSLNPKNVSNYLEKFNFKDIFIEELGWNRPDNPKPLAFDVNGLNYKRTEIADLAGLKVFEIEAPDDNLPNAATRREVYQEVSKVAQENLLIFLGQQRTQSNWYWVKREGSKRVPRDHYYYYRQPGDLFISKLSGMLIGFDEIEGITVTEATRRLAQALDVAQVTKRFYEEFRAQHLAFLELIVGIDSERDRRWYASVLLNRLMFIYFLQKKGFIGNPPNYDYLKVKLNESKTRGANRYYSEFLEALFFEGFAKPKEHRNPAAATLIGEIPYLNGGLFLQHAIEIKYAGKITVSDEAFANILQLFERYSWNLDDRPGGNSNEINPDVLGYIFEKYINQRKAFGAYYTRPEITDYLCRQTIHSLILARIKEETGREFASFNDLQNKLDVPLCKALLLTILPRLSLLDPACGSGAFLVAALKTLIEIYGTLVGKILSLGDATLRAEIKGFGDSIAKQSYNIKRRIITDNLFGVDLYEEANEIAKLRLFLTLVASVQSVDELEPLPNIDFNILAGNSLIGLLRVDETQYNLRLGAEPYRKLVEEKNRLVSAYRHAATYSQDLQALRDDIQAKRADAIANLNETLTEEFKKLKISFEQIIWDTAKNEEGKPNKRALKDADIEALHPFHWGYEFDEVMNQRGGFDVIITNPPWEIFKPQAKEFFADYSDVVTKNKMTIKEFEEKQADLLKEDTSGELLQAWTEYLSYFPHQSHFFRSAPQYLNQISVVNGKKAGTDINLYKLFTEQCYNLMRDGGQCGIVIPSGIYTDLGTKQLREMLFKQTMINGLFGFENRKTIFEGVDSRFKFVVLTFDKGGKTTSFPAAFMRLEVKELDRFPQEGALPVSVDLIRKLSPDSLSIMEFKGDIDAVIAQKMLKFALLGEAVAGKWKLKLTREFDMTNDSKLFKTTNAPGCLPLYEGKMVHQFTHLWEGGKPRYWVDEEEGRKAVLGRKSDTGQKLEYQDYRLGFRDIASNTNERTMISSIIPPAFHGNKLPTVEPLDETGKVLLKGSEQLFLCAVWNSFVIDWMLRSKVTTTLNFFYVYQLPVPRLTEGDAMFRPLVEGAASLICTTAEFKDLWETVIGTPWQDPTPPTPEEASPVAADVTSPDNTPPPPPLLPVPTVDAAKRAKLRAELDGIVAHLYGLTEVEFSHILSTFPLVKPEVKDAAMQAYRALIPNPDDEQVLKLIKGGETERVEFKIAASWNANKKDDRGNPAPKRDESMKTNIIEAVAAFANSWDGGTVIIGVDDKTGSITGLQGDYDELNKPDRSGAKTRKDDAVYREWLNHILTNAIKPKTALIYELTFHKLEGQEVCRITVSPAAEPLYANDDLYLRGVAGKRKLKASEVPGYIQRRWGI